MERVIASGEETVVPSVNLVQLPEPRPQSSPASPSRGSDTFADLFESSAKTPPKSQPQEPGGRHADRTEPPAAHSRARARSEPIARKDRPEPEAERPCDAGARKCAAPEQGNAPADDEVTETDKSAEPQPPATEATGPVEATDAAYAALPVQTTTDETAPLPADPASKDADGDAQETAAIDLAAPGPMAANVTSDTAAIVPVVTIAPDGAELALATVESDAALAAVGADEAKPAAAPGKVPAIPASAASSDSKPIEAAALAAAGAGDKPAAPAADATQTRQPAPTNSQPAVQSEPATAARQDLPQPTPQNVAQSKAQEPTLPPSTDTPQTPAPTADASAPRQPANSTPPMPMPDPVRALASSLNPASIHAATASEPNPVPLTGTALAFEIMSRMREGLRRFEIRLDPPELGRVDVRLDVDRHGHATTRLTVDRPETLDLLQREARGLERALQQAGLKTDAGGLEFTLRQQTNEGMADGRPDHAATGSEMIAVDETGLSDAVIEGYRSAVLARGGVDIRI
jgi:chemotaxis protein MotD